MKYDISKKLALVKFYYETLQKYDDYNVNDNLSYDIAVLTQSGLISGKPSFSLHTEDTKNLRLAHFICDHNLIMTDYLNFLEKDLEKKLKQLEAKEISRDEFLLYEPLETDDTLVLKNVTIHNGNNSIKLESITIFSENILGISFIKRN
ncbi:MAG: hypothetical protein HXM14_00710 [Fusobacterium periodonticum]|nr:hypothetical protein [Fusobacterium periodonticum]